MSSESSQEPRPAAVRPDGPSPDGSGREGSQPAAAGTGPTALRSFVGLFVVPLLVVLVCVAVFIGFGWIAYERQSTRDYLNDLRSSWRPRRAQAAYELSKILLADPGALDDAPGVKEEVRRLFAEAEDEEMRRYLALVLGYTRDPEAVPLLTGALAEAGPELRVYVLWALGAVGDPRAGPPLVAALSEADAGLRKTAAFALGELGDPGAVGALEPLLADPVADVRWNAALALARLGSPAGRPVLLQMLDRGFTSQVPGITAAQTEEVMVGAVRALGTVAPEPDAEARRLLERLAAEDPSLKVRQAALEALGGR